MDDRLASAISHWAPRFTTNGVTAGDFARITGSIASWSQWCGAWSDVAAEHEALGDEALDDKRMRSAGAHYAQAATYYHFAKFVFVEDLNQMRQAHASAVRCLMRALPHLDPPGERIEIPFENGTMVGVLRLPAGQGPHPAVLMVPGLDSTKEELRSTEELFLQRGLATLSIDGPGQGEAEYDLPIRGDWEVPGRVLLDWLGAREEIAADRIAVWGVSLGGYYAPRIASGDERVRACVALCGPYNFGEVWGGLPELTRETFRVRSYTDSDDQARLAALELGMAGRTGQITCPLLVVAGKRDRLIPWQDAQRLADEVAGARLLAIDIGNHGCANVAPMHRYRTADWVAQQLA
ncbi:MAG TPA: alpha/beta hydrolase [Pseudonocardiaceae bacterium]|nr:alpha/beta hydrolase [Pseudonocardiaceae bacterium]